MGQDDGRVYFYRNVGTNASPQFEGYELLRTTNNTVIDAYYGSRFCFSDWKEDGDPDLLISGFYGYVEYYENASMELEERPTSKAGLDFKIFPNPVRTSAVLDLTLRRPARVLITLLAADGRMVRTLIDQKFSAGQHHVVLNTEGLKSGVYFIRFDDTISVKTGRVVVMH
ncbi:MAG TPA: T9SS type A sorting domain-containing protein [bacterium (Candidatus Stahlbacteria)]|nr:T9SS type A sorting domain-containing protein [Candidatus Stahlbacteria bacterium]